MRRTIWQYRDSTPLVSPRTPAARRTARENRRGPQWPTRFPPKPVPRQSNANPQATSRPCTSHPARTRPKPNPVSRHGRLERCQSVNELPGGPQQRRPPSQSAAPHRRPSPPRSQRSGPPPAASGSPRNAREVHCKRGDSQHLVIRSPGGGMPPMSHQEAPGRPVPRSVPRRLGGSTPSTSTERSKPSDGGRNHGRGGHRAVRGPSRRPRDSTGLRTAWAAAQIGRPNTVRITDNALRLHILPQLGDRPMHSVRRSDVQALVKACSETLAPEQCGTSTTHWRGCSRPPWMTGWCPSRHASGSSCRRIEDAEICRPRSSRSCRWFPQSTRASVVLLSCSRARACASASYLAPRSATSTSCAGLSASCGSGSRTARSRQPRPASRCGPCRSARWSSTSWRAHLAAYPSGTWLFTTRRGEPLTYRYWKNVWRLAKARRASKPT